VWLFPVMQACSSRKECRQGGRAGHVGGEPEAPGCSREGARPDLLEKRKKMQNCRSIEGEGGKGLDPRDWRVGTAGLEQSVAAEDSRCWRPAPVHLLSSPISFPLSFPLSF